jgi:hypothetical protein
VKSGLLVATLVAGLLLGFLVYWRTGPAEGAASGSQAPPGAAVPASPLALSGETPPPEGIDRSAATPTPIADPNPVRGPASSEAPRGKAVATVTESSLGSDEAEDARFVRKYEAMATDERRAALESLRALLESGRTLSEAQLLGLKREIEWLTAHQAP